MGYGDYFKKAYGPSSASEDHKPWYERELDLISGFDDSEYKGRSVSHAREYLGHHAWGERTFTKDKEGKLNRVSTEIVRLMNTVLNSEAGKKERTLSIAWSDGARAGQNSPRSDQVFLSPNLVVGEDGNADNSNNPEIVDGLGGQVLMGSTLKRTMSSSAFSAALADQSAMAKHNRSLWEAVETAKAKQQLIGEWPGFAPYLKRHQSITSSAQEEVQQFIDSKPDTLSAAVAAASWTIVNPRQPLNLTPKIQSAIDKIAADLDDSTSTGRFIAAQNAVDYLRTQFVDDGQQQQPPPPGGNPPPGGDGNGKGQTPPPPGGNPGKPGNEKGDGKGGKDDKDGQPSDGKTDSNEPGGSGAGPSGQKTQFKMPKITDDSLFGKGVESNHADVPAPIDAKEDATNREGADCPEGLGSAHRHSKIYYDPVPTSEYMKQQYKKLVSGIKPLIRAITSAISFRRTAPEFPLHGLLSGDLDDGSLDKLALRENRPAVFERKEITAIPDVGICLLVDESGSMSCRSEHARMVCAAMFESFKQLRGLKLMVLGYTDGGGTCMFDHYSQKNQAPEKIVGIGAHSGTPTGFAMEEAVKRLANEFPTAKQKFLFVITDGNPNGGFDGLKFCLNVSTWARRRFGIRTYGIGVCNAMQPRCGNLAFGEGNYINLADTLGSAKIIASFLARVTSKV